MRLSSVDVIRNIEIQKNAGKANLSIEKKLWKK